MEEAEAIRQSDGIPPPPPLTSATPDEQDPEPTPPGPGKPSDPAGTSDGWGQPNALVVSGGCDKDVRVWVENVFG